MAEQQAQVSLEDQLRNMILTNVTMGPGPAGNHQQSNYQQSPRGRGRGRGRGRPEFTRGRGGAPTQHNAVAPRIFPRPQDASRNVSNLAQPASHPMPNVQPGNQPRPVQPMRSHYANPGFQQRQFSDPTLQAAYLDHLASREVTKVEITQQELEEKEGFRHYLESVCQKALIDRYTDIALLKLVTFGSLASGFATPGSDMDLAVVLTVYHPTKLHLAIVQDFPRLLERAVLDAEMGGRLLTRTRVPILKVCQKPSEELYKALVKERQKWDELPEDEKYSPPTASAPAPSSPAKANVEPNSAVVNNNHHDFPTLKEAKTAQITARPAPKTKAVGQKDDDKAQALNAPTTDGPSETVNNTESGKEQQPRAPRQWLREKKLGPLDFPKSGIGIQCDINFENPLAIHNTQLLRCYSLSDPRVRPMVLFVKAWAKRRKINSSYSGTLSSYGWVLMTLHYLVNIADPPVCPNLQSCWQPVVTQSGDLEQLLRQTMVNGYAVRFWRDEAQIAHLASTGQLTRNTQSIGELLRGFFQYYASISQPDAHGQRPWCFYWATEVLSLRTPGGIRQKIEKGWTKATTTCSNGKEVRQRYLLSIEDPFELDHNVARTVTHDGIVAIRDELRRAGRILVAVGKGQPPEGGLFDEVVERESTSNRAEAGRGTPAAMGDTSVVANPGSVGGGGEVEESAQNTKDAAS